jgi:hypothetical protein
VARAFCDANVLRIAPHPPYSLDLASSDFSYLGISKIASKDNNSGLQMNFFRESEKFWTELVLALWKLFSGSGSTSWAMHCSTLANEK